MPERDGRVLTGAFIAVATAALAGGAVVGTAGSAAAGRPPVGARSAIVWEACQQPEAARFDAQCGTMRVPIDWAAPAGPAVDLALLRVPATGAATGTVVGDSEDLNGLGGSQISFFLQHGANYLSRLPRTHAGKDIVIFDPRGLGGSAAVNCPVAGHDPHVSSFPTSVGAYDRLAAHDTAVFARCQGAGNLTAHLGLRDQVRDVDALRAALGEARLDWLGQVSGGQLGAAYAAAFPGRVGRVVLDAAVDPYRSPADRALDAASAEETAFGHFAAWCAAARPTDCALNGQDVGGVLDQAVARADAGGVSDGMTPPGSLSGAEVRIAVGQYLLGYPVTWPDLARGIAAAAGNGDGGLFGAFAAMTYADPDYTASRLQNCADTPAPIDFPELRRLVERAHRSAPRTGGVSLAWEALAACVSHPTSRPPLTLPARVEPASPILVTATTGDPISPHRWSADLARHLTDSRLLTAALDGHGAFDDSACAASAIDGYLADGVLPADGTVCRS